MASALGSATRSALFALLAVSPVFLAVSPVLAASPFDSDWSPSAKSRARLIADAQGPGLDIELAPGAVTYWRDPGDAGVAPSFDFSGSQNLGKAEVAFPAPQRIVEPDGSVAFGYRDAVILPIAVTPADPGRAVRLVARVNYAVCEKICLPAKADVAVVLSRGVSPHADALQRARAAVPTPVAAKDLGVVVDALGAKSWRLCLPEAPRELFVEAPEGYWIEPKRDADGRCYTLNLRQAPDGAKAALEVEVTVERAEGAVETKVALGG